MTLEGKGGRDPTKSIVEGVKEHGKKVTREAMVTWNTEAQKRVMEAASGRSTIDSEGRQGRQNNNLHELAQSFTVPVWDEQREAWVFAVTNRFANIHEWGAMPHEIEAKQAQALVFEWPDAPQEVREKFEKTFPKVFYDSVEHPGAPAIGYMRYGREKARNELQNAGFSTKSFAKSIGGDDGSE